MNVGTSPLKETRLDVGDLTGLSESKLSSSPQLIQEPESEPDQALQFIPTQLSAIDRAGTDGNAANWREELSDRVVTFRKRRGRIQPENTEVGNLELEFENLGKPNDFRAPSHDPEGAGRAEPGFDLDMGNTAFAEQQNAFSFDKPKSRELRNELHLDEDPEETEEEMSLGEPAEKSLPMEILVNSPAAHPADDTEIVGHFYAPLQRRFLAGLVDGGLLLLGAALFGGIFWYSMTRFCDHNVLAPISLAILGLIAMIVIFAYFAVFTALSFATPGMLWTSCEVRNLQGEHPTVNESLWRAFGVLVSISALMVGFVWAYVDSESLTWHDRMSGTVITDVETATRHAGPKVKS
jgi:uncharacterized RDD family membrane protein YckC